MDLVSGIAVAAVTTVVVVGGLVAAGFVALFKRRGDHAIPAAGANDLPSLGKRASAMLVRLDDDMREADNELGYALAQFGADQARPYGDAVAEARSKVTEAFRLRQALDDSVKDSEREQREWTLQIIALCEQADTALSQQDARFTAMRGLEVNAASTLVDVRARIAATAARVPQARELIASLTDRYRSPALAQVAANPDAAEAQLAIATTQSDAAAAHITASGVSAVSTTLEQASAAAHTADQLLDSVDRAARDLDAAVAALAKLVTGTKIDLAEAATERDSAPDAESGRAIIDAMTAVEASLIVADGPPDPIAEIDRIGAAVTQLDRALASARNQAQRLAHARAAYESTVVSATSQIAAVRDYIGSRGGGVAARTRLAEAERQFTLAQNEIEPVEALDTIRRAVTLARDADALARYDTMGSA